MSASTRVRSVWSRVGECLPAAISWAVIVATVVGLIFYPFQWMWVAVAIFAYFVVWTAFHLVFHAVGLRRCREWAARDWLTGRNVPGPDGIAPADVWHLVLVPNYTEPVPVLRRTLDALASQQDARERLVVVLAMEEREADSRSKGERLAEEYRDRFARVLVTTHPKDLPGEVPCKGSNMRWAVHVAREEIGRMGIDTSRVTLTACDADSVFDRNYFAAIAELFARDMRRHSRFWEAPLFFYNNMWQVPAPVRFNSRLSQLYMLAELATPGYEPLPISTYTMSLRLGEECDWWDPTVIAEDWHVYLDYMVQRHGDVSVVPVYLPVRADSPDGATYLAALKNRYVQVRRHAWGATDVGFLVEQLLSGRMDRQIWFRFAQVLHDHMLPVVGFGTATTLSFLPVFVALHGVGRGGGASGVAILAFVTSGLFVVSTVTLLSAMALDVLRFPPPSRRISEMVIEIAKAWGLLPVIGLVFSVVPTLDAQTKLALGLPLGWRVTPKRWRREERADRASATVPVNDSQS